MGLDLNLREAESSPLSLPCRHDGCSLFGSDGPARSQIRDARACSAGRPRNFTPVVSGNYGHFGSDAMQLRTHSKMKWEGFSKSSPTWAEPCSPSDKFDVAPA